MKSGYSTGMDKVLVTGLAGMVGSRFGELYGEKYLLESLDLTNGVDITDSQSVNRIIGQSTAKTVIHLAAFTNVAAAHEQKDDKAGPCYRVNVIGTENIVAACHQYGKYLIHVSTDFIFDGTKSEFYTEADVPRPIEWYGQTKYMAEQAVTAGLNNYVILRLAYPYQAKPVRPDFLANMLAKMGEGTLPPQFTDHTITPTFVDDLCKVFDYCITNKPNGLYHATGSSWHTDYEMVEMVKQIFKIEAKINPGSLTEYLKQVKRPYQKKMKVSNLKLTKEFGIKMKTFEEGLKIIKQQLA